MKIELYDKEFNIHNNEHLNIKTEYDNNDILTKNNERISTKEEEENHDIIYDEPIEYRSSPRYGIVSINVSKKRNYNKFLQLTDYGNDIPNTISMIVRPIKTILEVNEEEEKIENNKNFNNHQYKSDNVNMKERKLEINSYNKKSAINKDKKDLRVMSSLSNIDIKKIRKEKYSVLIQTDIKNLEYKKKSTSKIEKKKSGKIKKINPLENIDKKEKLLKRKSTSYSMSLMSEKLKKKKQMGTTINHISNSHQIKEKNKGIEEDIENKNKNSYINNSKSKYETPNIIIYGSDESSDNNDSNKDKKSKNLIINTEFLIKKNHSNISSGDINYNKTKESLEQKIVKPKTKASSKSINRLKLKQNKNKRSDKADKSENMIRNFTSNNFVSRIKFHKLNSAFVKERTAEKEKDKDSKKSNLLKLITTTKNLLKEEPKLKYRNSMQQNLRVKSHINIKKKSVDTMTKELKQIFKKPNSNLSLKITKEDAIMNVKKSNKNLTYKGLDKSFLKKKTFNLNLLLPRIAIDTKNQENDRKDVHLFVKGKEETIINYTNTQMIKDEKEYMIDCLKILAKIKKEEGPRCKQKVNFNFPPEEKQKKIALFDLDETLVHCLNNNTPGIDGDIVSIKLPTNKIVKVGLNIRKNWRQAFDLIKNHYHIVVYTASHPSYADAVLNYMDKDNKYFKYRLYRSHCIQCDVDGFKFYVKDLDTLDKYYNLKDIVIIDNSILSFAYHLYNGIPIVPFIDQPNDTELIFTAHYLMSIANYDDLCLENKKHLNLDNLLTMAKQINEIEDNEEDEEDDYVDTNGESFNLIEMDKDKDKDKEKDIKIENTTNINTINDNTTNVNNNNEDINNTIKNDNANNNTTTKFTINIVNNSELENKNENKVEIMENDVKEKKNLLDIPRARDFSLKKTRKTVKIAEDMKKNIDEMLKKKKEELELDKIEED